MHKMSISVFEVGSIYWEQYDLVGTMEHISTNGILQISHQWKINGKDVTIYTCSYLPEIEISTKWLSKRHTTFCEIETLSNFSTPRLS